MFSANASGVRTRRPPGVPDEGSGRSPEDSAGSAHEPSPSVDTAPQEERKPNASEPFLAGIRGPDAPSLKRGKRKVDQETVRRAMVRQLVAHSQVTERLTLAIALTLAVGLRGVFEVEILLPWMAAVAAATGVRAWVRRRLRVHGASPERFLGEFRWSVVLVALAWAWGPLAMAGTMETGQVAVLLVLYAGLTSVAASSLAPDRRSFLIFVTTLMVPAGGAIALGGLNPVHRVLLALSLLLAVTMAVLATRAGKALASTVRIQEALRKSQRTIQSERALLDALIRSAPTAIVAVNSHGHVLGINPAFESLFGWSPPEALGRSLDELVVAPDRANEAADLFASVSDGAIVTRDVVRRHKAGRSIPVHVSAARSHDALVDAVFVLYEDRTAEVKAHEALATAEEHYRDLVESSLDLVWKVDISGRWTFLNAAAQELYGAPPGSLLGTRFSDRVVDSRKEADLAAMRSVLAGNALSDYESLHRAVDGTLRCVSFTGRPILDPSGAIIGAQGTARDVSERAAIREALEKARELALHAASDKTTFLANMSHEIRTPMNAVIGMIEILLTSELNSDQRRSGEIIRSSAGALLTLIDDILDFSKLGSEHFELETIPFSVHSLIESTTRLLSVEADRKGLDVEYHVGASVPHRTLGDPGRVRQVVTNLLGNALKFTHQGSVSIAVDTEIDPTAQGTDRLVFRITDTGVGIAPDKIGTIFDPFTQADASTTRRYGGTGLGLAICKGLVDAMHGGISTESALGVGSEFMFWIPLRVAPAAGPPVPIAPRFSGKRALVVEAHPDDRTDIERLLLPLDMSLTFAASATEAMSRVSDSGEPHAFDIVLLDRAVQEMDGFELAAQLRGETGDGVPIVMLSSEPRIGEGARCRALGIDGYLPKPLNRGDFLEVIGRLLSRDDEADTRDELVTRHSIAEARRALHILLVEDNRLNQEVATALLQRRGHTIDVVECGTEAVDAVQLTDYDVVLMDIQLPGIDGVEATRRIRATALGRELPIVALTAHAFGEERDRAMAAGMNDFLSKPFRPHDLFAVVEGWLPASARIEGERADGQGPPVDVAGFRLEMSEVGIESVVDESLALFVATAPDRIAAIVTAGKQGDLVTAAREAHGFKSAAGTIRAQHLFELLDQVEDAANTSQADAVSELVDQCAEACEAALEYLQAHAPAPEPA